MKQAFQAYSSFVGSRLKPANDIRADIDKHSDDTINMAHCAMGMAGEFLEMKFAGNPEELKKELGDFVFYLVGALRALKIPFPETLQADGIEIDPQVHMLNSMQMERALKDVVEITKKEFFFNMVPSPDQSRQRRDALQFLMQGVASMTGLCKTNTEGLLDSNVTKLTKRYPTQYSDYAAAKRVDVK